MSALTEARQGLVETNKDVVAVYFTHLNELGKAGMWPVTAASTTTEIFSRPLLTDIYPTQQYESIHKQSLKKGSGEMVRYSRWVTRKSRKKEERSKEYTTKLVVDYYPAGVPTKIADEINEYYKTKLSPDSQRERFGSFYPKGLPDSMLKVYTSKETRVLLLRSTERGKEKNIIGTVLVASDGTSAAPEIANDIATHMHGKGLGITGMTDMLGILDAAGIHDVVFSIFAFNRRSIKSTRRVGEKPEIPWKTHQDSPAGGWIDARFTKAPQKILQ